MTSYPGTSYAPFNFNYIATSSPKIGSNKPFRKWAIGQFGSHSSPWMLSFCNGMLSHLFAGGVDVRLDDHGSDLRIRKVYMASQHKYFKNILASLLTSKMSRKREPKCFGFDSLLCVSRAEEPQTFKGFNLTLQRVQKNCPWASVAFNLLCCLACWEAFGISAYLVIRSQTIK